MNVIYKVSWNILEEEDTKNILFYYDIESLITSGAQINDCTIRTNKNFLSGVWLGVSEVSKLTAGLSTMDIILF